MTPADTTEQDQADQDSPGPAPRTRARRLLPLLLAAGCVLGGGILGTVALPAVVARLETPEALRKPEPDLKAAAKAVTMEPITVIANLADESGRRYLRAGVVLEARDEQAKTRLEARAIEVKDLLNSLLSEKSLKDVEGKDKRDQLRREVRLSINERLRLPDAVVQVYFSDFVIE